MTTRARRATPCGALPPPGDPTVIQHWQQIRYDAFGEFVSATAITSGAPTDLPPVMEPGFKLE